MAISQDNLEIPWDIIPWVKAPRAILEIYLTDEEWVSLLQQDRDSYIGSYTQDRIEPSLVLWMRFQWTTHEDFMGAMRGVVEDCNWTFERLEALKSQNKLRALEKLLLAYHVFLPFWVCDPTKVRDAEESPNSSLAQLKHESFYLAMSKFYTNDPPDNYILALSRFIPAVRNVLQHVLELTPDPVEVWAIWSIKKQYFISRFGSGIWTFQEREAADYAISESPGEYEIRRVRISFEKGVEQI